jgi:ubiquinone biosynthesis protein
VTSSVTHVARLLRWGRTLGTHGALLGIERDPMAPRAIRRLARLSRIGARLPATPRYADALEAIGPPAIKFGQALATRPDLVGEDAALDLFRLQDALPPVPFPLIRAAIEQGLGRPIGALFASIEERPIGAASIAQVHRAVTTDGRHVAVKVLRPGVEDEFAEAIDTYGWAAAHADRMGGEVTRLRPRLVVATFERWTSRELDLRREAASASELAERMAAEPGFHVPAIDWDRTARRVMTLEWIDGIKLSDRTALIAAGHDLKALAETLVRSFLRQAIADGFFHADLHQGNLFAMPDGRVAAVDFGIMGRIDRRARVWLAEILHGLITGDYQRVAEIHFEAQYVPPHHSAAEFASALRAVGEPIRGKAVADISVGQMLDGLFSITRDFDMPTQPHLLLLQKTMVMVEGVATSLHPGINMWEVATPVVGAWLRDELGPEALVADRIRRLGHAVALLPDLVDRLDRAYPAPGGAPPPPPLREVAVVRLGGWRAGSLAAVAALAGAILGHYL